MKKGADEIMQELMGNPNYRDLKRGNTALHVAVERKHLGYTKTLLEAKADPGFRPWKGISPFELAFHRDDVPFVELMLGHERVPRDEVLVHDCVRYGLPKVLQFLLNTRSHCKNTLGPYGYTLLDCALQTCQLLCASVLLDARVPYRKSLVFSKLATDLLEARCAIKTMVCVLIGLGKRRCVAGLCKDTARLIAAYVWETRDDSSVWRH